MGLPTYEFLKPLCQYPQLETYWPPHLSVVPHDIGEAQAADTTTAKSQHVLTADKLDLSQLQTDPHKKNK
jgi:hypothetical protein